MRLLANSESHVWSNRRRWKTCSNKLYLLIDGFSPFHFRQTTTIAITEDCEKTYRCFIFFFCVCTFCCSVKREYVCKRESSSRRFRPRESMTERERRVVLRASMSAFLASTSFCKKKREREREVVGGVRKRRREYNRVKERENQLFVAGLFYLQRRRNNNGVGPERSCQISQLSRWWRVQSEMQIDKRRLFAPQTRNSTLRSKSCYTHNCWKARPASHHNTSLTRAE